MTKDSSDYILSLRPQREPCCDCENLVWYCPPNGYIKYWTCFVIDSCPYMQHEQKEINECQEKKNNEVSE